MSLTAPQIKKLSHESLVSLSLRVGNEISSRVSRLDAGLRSMGIDGLRLHAENKIPVLVKFSGYQKYTYLAPTGTEIGDLVETPDVGYGKSIVKVVGIGTNGYTGPIKSVLRVFKETSR
jgi:hypothetical protein